MTMIRRLVLLFSLLLNVSISYSQERDFGIWYGASAEFKIIKNLDLDFSTCFRTIDNAALLEQFFLEGEVSYTFKKYLTAAASYRITENIEEDNAYHIRHKWFADVKATLPLGKFRLSGRAMFQRRYKTYFADKNDRIPRSHARYRLKAIYKTPAMPVDPYLYTELFTPLFRESDRRIDKKRAAAGIEIKIARQHFLEVEYLFQRDYFPRLTDENILSLCYTVKF